MKRLLYIFALLFVTLNMMATDIIEGTVLYLKPNSNWKQSNARFAAYFFGNGEAWVDMKHIGDDVYVCVSPNKSYPKVIFCRMNPSASANNWNNNWNQSGDLTWDGSKNLFTVPDGWWDGATTEWSAYSCSWTLAGEPATLFGETWQPGKSENDLVYENNGIWKKTYSKVSLSKGSISFKVCKDHKWDFSHPSSNQTYTIGKEGIYNVTFTFSYKDLSISVVTEEVIEPTIAITNEDVAYIEDSFSIGFESNIDNPSVSYFVKVPGVNVYSKINGADYKFDVVGKYRFKVEFTHGGDVVSAEKDIEVKYSAFVAGTEALCGSEWNGSDEANKMEKVDGIFKKTYTNVPVGTHKFKIVYKGSWLGFEKLESNDDCSNVDGGNIQFTLDKSRDVIISFNPTTSKITLKIVYDNFPVGEKFYFSPKTEGARYAAYLFGTSGDNWVDIEKEYNNVYSFTMPEGEWDGLIYCEMNSGTIENNWDNKKVQTADLRYDGVNNWYVEGENSNYWRNFENLIFAGQKLYFKPDSNWEADGARFAAYYWDVLGENKWADCVYNEENDVYEVIAPIVADTVGEDVFESVWTNIKFLRMNPDFEDNGWNKGDEDETEEPKRVWNKTEDLVFDGINDLFIIKLTKKNGEYWDWDSADINNWVNYGTCFKDFIFFKPNEAQKNNRFAIWLWNGFGDGCWAKFQILAKYNNIYYVVIPDGFWTGANICSMNPETIEDNWDNKLLQTQNLTYHSDKLLYKVPNVWEEQSIENECWSNLEAEIDFDPENAIEINGGMENGAYYQAKKYTMSISGSDVNKWHWISLPYDVNVADIKSNITAENPYGIDFIMKRYDTATRAAWEGEQAPVDDQTWVQLTEEDVLEAGRGYILGVKNSLTGVVTLTFPANSYFHIVSNQVDGKNDNIEAPIQELNVNSNWHLIGTGLYAEAQSSGGVNFVAYPDESGSDYTYHYLGSVVEHEYFEPTQIAVSMLEKYKAFFVQYGGEYSFSKEAVVRNMAPRRARTEEDVEQYYINIKGEKERSRTAIFLADDGSDAYVVGKDFLHFGVTGKTIQLYTKQNSRLFSFNHLKKEDCVVELGGYVVNAGEYTISLTDNGASSIVLIDNYTGESVDLTFEDYTFTTEKGSLDGRFTLAISYIEKDVTTEIGNENVGNILVSNYNDLVVVEGLTIGNHVWIYDAVGRCVSSFVAEEGRYVLNVKEGAYVLKTSMESVKFVVW